MGPTTLRIAVLVLPPIQLLDVAPVDLFAMLSKQYLAECGVPAPFLALGLDKVDIYYVGEDGPSTTPSSTDTNTSTILAETTASLSLRITHNFSSQAVQPGSIDILLVPGPDPKLVASDAAKQFMVLHANCASTTIMSICTGVIPLAQAGVLDGRTCTGPRFLLGTSLRKNFPRAKWTEKRWDVSNDEIKGKGDVWTAGGITNGQDMVAAYIRKNFKRELADLVCAMADVGGRGQEYTTGAAAEGMWWGFLLLRSWVGGFFSGKGKQEVVAKQELVG